MVAIAMIGNPPIILLDEPSTGMDPEARHDMWDVIQRISTTKKQASVILTTHSMDEAEALSRKIAILVDGEVKCIGNQQYLKDKFGKGYETDIKIKELNQEELNERI
jgi:ATP-binding cassette subfamily A (ABC1) protein 3